MRLTKKQTERDEDNLPTFRTGEEFDALLGGRQGKSLELLQSPHSALGTACAPTLREKAIIARQRRHNRKVGRPRVGNGAKMVAVTIEKGLLKRADAYAKRHGMKRAAMIAQGLLLVMAEK